MDAYTVRAALLYPDQVAALAKARYYEIYGTKLNISNSSLRNEIMVHAMAYKSNFKIKNSSTSECGEGSFLNKNGDTNRWFWDLISGRN